MRFGFLIKAALAMALVVGFDRLFADGLAGARIGGFAGIWLILLVIGRHDVRRNRGAWIALSCSALFAGSLFDDPGPLAWALFWCALSIAALMPKAARFDDALRWAARLAIHAVVGVVQPIVDLKRVVRIASGERRSPRRMLSVLALPVVGGAIFIILFAAANPLIAQAFATLRFPSAWQVLLWGLVAACIWPSLRPSAAVMGLSGHLPDTEPVVPGTSLPSVLIALAVFNAIFAVQNGLDIAFLWSGGTLPAGMVQSDYVHRGAYPLIATALVAGVMALAMLRPGSAAARHPWARRLVTLWVVQNLVLVASSVLRTLDYIDTSMLTAWRIAALIWMALVAFGLLTICRRILAGHSARWLINWNALAAAVALSACSVVDLGAIAAAWNVRSERPAAVDLCYLHQVGDGALLPLVELERRPMDAGTRDRVRYVRHRILTDLSTRQDSWQHWTPRGARRLARATAMLGRNPAGPAAVDPPVRRTCDGSIGRPSPSPQP